MRALRSPMGLLVVAGLVGAGLMLSGCGRSTKQAADAPVEATAEMPLLAMTAGAYTAADYARAKRGVARAKELRREKRRSEALQLYLDVLPILRSFARTNRKRDACLALARAEHGLGAIYLVKKNYATAYVHYRNSVFYFEYGGYPQRVHLSGSDKRVKQMEKKIKEKRQPLPSWESPL